MSVVALLALFGAGVVASISPCSVPLLPGYLLVAGDSSALERHERVRRLAAFVLAVVGTFVVLGAAAGSIGGIDLDPRILERIGGAVLLVLAAMLLVGLRGRGPRFALDPSFGRWRAVALGVGTAAAWTPCVGPLLGAALTAAAGSGSVWRGSILLAAFALGVLTPFVVLAAAPWPAVRAWTRRSGAALSHVSVGLMALLGIALIAGWYDRFVALLPVD